MTVGAHPREIVFATDNTTAWVITAAGVNVVTYAQLGAVGKPPLLPVIDDPGIDPATLVLPPSVVPASGQQLALGLDDNDSRGAAAEPSARPRRIGWASLLARVFAVAVTVCRKCGGRMRIFDVVTDPGHIARILHGARAPPRPPRAHPPGQLLLLPT